MREGRFSWDGAPDEPRNFCFLKRGYQSKRGQTLRPGEENMVVLHTDRTIQGWVVDAKTEKPITKFKVSVGRRRGDSFNANWPGMREYIDPNGAFSITAGEEGRNAVKVEADEYEEQLADLPKDNQDVTSLTFKLKPSASVRAILVDTQGMPVAGASVALCEDSPVSLIRLEKGRLTAYNSGNRKITTTGEDGRFTLPSKDGAILAASTRDGFGSASIDEVRNTGRLVLQEFGRIEGTIQVAGAPMAGQELMWSLSQIGIMPDQDFAKTTSDEQGRFVFEKVPAREVSVVRLIKTGQRSWAYSHNTNILVEAGKTTQVRFGENGATIKGRVVLDIPAPHGKKVFLEARLRTKMPEPKRAFSSLEEAQAYYDSPEMKARTKATKLFSGLIDKEGILTIDSVPAGAYTLNVTATEQSDETWSRSFANASVEVTVPENPDSSSVIQIGDVALKAAQTAPRNPSKPKTR